MDQKAGSTSPVNVQRQ